MKLGLMFTSTTYTTAEECAAVATIAEEMELESLWAVEHVMIPRHLESAYPYTEDGQLGGLATADIFDPVVWLSFMAGITRTVRLATGVLILPQRHPALVAKEWATLDCLSGGRAILGVGVGWLRQEVEALNARFESRGRRADETIRAIRSLWRDETSTIDGEFFRWNEMIANPRPLQPGGVPIVVGGHSPAAVRRAARLGDGYFWPGNLSSKIRAPGDDDTLGRLIQLLRDECQAVGRDAAEVEITIGAYRPTHDDVQRLRDLGVSRLVVNPPRVPKLRERLEGLRALLA